MSLESDDNRNIQDAYNYNVRYLFIIKKIDHKQTMSKATSNKFDIKRRLADNFYEDVNSTCFQEWTHITWKLTKLVYRLFFPSINIIHVALCLINYLELINNIYPGYKY